jgi:hypothetical protein
MEGGVTNLYECTYRHTLELNFCQKYWRVCYSKKEHEPAEGVLLWARWSWRCPMEGMTEDPKLQVEGKTRERQQLCYYKNTRVENHTPIIIWSIDVLEKFIHLIKLLFRSSARTPNYVICNSRWLYSDVCVSIITWR